MWPYETRHRPAGRPRRAAVPGAAPAQAPLDERAAAQAFADAAKRVEAATEAAIDGDTSWLDPCERMVERVPERHQDKAVMLVLSHSFRVSFAEMREPL